MFVLIKNPNYLLNIWQDSLICQEDSGSLKDPEKNFKIKSRIKTYSLTLAHDVRFIIYRVDIFLFISPFQLKLALHMSSESSQMVA